MNRQQTTTILAYIAEVWSNRPADARTRVEVWADLLADVDYGLAQQAVKELAKTSQFPPSVPDIMRKIGELQDGPIPSWVEIKALIERSHYDPETMRDAHPIVRAVRAKVGGATTLAALSPSEAERTVRMAAQAETAGYAAAAVRSSAPALESSTVRAVGRGGLQSINEALS